MSENIPGASDCRMVRVVTLDNAQSTFVLGSCAEYCGSDLQAKIDAAPINIGNETIFNSYC